MEMGKVLEPLKPFRAKLNFIEGLYNEQALYGGIHSAQTGFATIEGEKKGRKTCHRLSKPANFGVFVDR